jgi:hypothetical protein
VRGIRLEDRIFIAGMTGKGKTTFAQWLVEQLQPLRVIVFDPKDELELGVQKARTPAELATMMHQPVVHYVPSGFERDELEEASQIVWETPGPYIWWIDETSEISSPSWVPQGMRLAVTQGRSKRKIVMALTQRLAESHPVFRSQAEHIIVFVPPPIELDLKTLAGAVNREHGVLRGELESLHAEHGDYSHLWYVRPTDELRRCEPLQLPPSTRRPAPAPPGPPEAPPTAGAQELEVEESAP